MKKLKQPPFIRDTFSTDNCRRKDFDLLQDIFQGRLQLGPWSINACAYSEYHYALRSCLCRMAD